MAEEDKEEGVKMSTTNNSMIVLEKIINNHIKMIGEEPWNVKGVYMIALERYRKHAMDKMYGFGSRIVDGVEVYRLIDLKMFHQKGRLK